MARALIILAEGFEELEAISVTDLLVRAGVDVVRAGLLAGPVRGSRHTCILPDCTLEAALDEAFDLVVLPGGLPGADNLAADNRVLQLLQRQFAEQKIVGAICAAPRALVTAGIHSNKTITCFPGALKDFDTSNCTLSSDRVCIDLPLVTSRGPGTAIDFALELINLLVGEEKKDAVRASLAG